MLYYDGQLFVMTMSLPGICSILLHQHPCLSAIRVLCWKNQMAFRPDKRASCLCSAGGRRIQVEHMPALPARLITTSGAGDCLVAGCCWSLLKGQALSAALAHGMVGGLFMSSSM